MTDVIGTVFISHKTSDAAIGKILADFISNESGDRVNVFFSSDARFLTPRGGRSLNDELTEAIGQSGALVLIYTGMTHQVDWAYCIYEAAYAKSRGIPVYIFQCRGEAPAPLRHLVRFSVSNEEDVTKFVNDFLTSTNFLSLQNSKVTNFSRDNPALQKKAKELFQQLDGQIKKLAEGAREWIPWPYARVRIDASDVSTIGERGKGFEERSLKANEALASRATVVDSKGIDQIFGVGVDDNDLVQRSLSAWREACPDESMTWYQALVDQIAAGTSRSFGPLRHEEIREAMGEGCHLPIVARTLGYPDGSMEFEVLFLSVMPRSSLLQDVMVPRDSMYLKIVGESLGDDSPIKDSFQEMVGHDRHRLPVLDKAGRIVYMIHRSMITEFIAQSATNGKPLGELTFEDMVSRPDMQKVFQTTFVFGRPDSTVEEARRLLRSHPGARDVFITRSGTSDEPIMGMLTTTDVVDKI